MANNGIREALKRSALPAARRKAAHTMVVSRAFANRFGTSATEFRNGTLLVKFMKKHRLAPDDLPPEIRKRLGPQAMKKLNGHAAQSAGVGIPLDAIPESLRRKPSERKEGSGNYPRSKAHPNAPQIDKILELIARPDMNDKVAERLLAALDKLIG